MRIATTLLPLLVAAPLAVEAFVTRPAGSTTFGRNKNGVILLRRVSSRSETMTETAGCGCGAGPTTTYAGNPSETAKSMNARAAMNKSPVYRLNGDKTTIGDILGDESSSTSLVILQYNKRRAELLAAGVNLVIVSIGKPQVGKDLVQHLGIPDGEEFLYVDPENEAYDNLDLNRGVGVTFFNPATPWAFGRRVLQGKSMLSEELSEVLSKWKDAFYIPPKQEQAFFQGGALLFSGDQTVYAHYDEATAAHAIPDDMIDMAVTTAAEA